MSWSLVFIVTLSLNESDIQREHKKGTFRIKFSNSRCLFCVRRTSLPQSLLLDTFLLCLFSIKGTAKPTSDGDGDDLDGTGEE